MGPTWVLSAPDGPHVGPMSLAIRVVIAIILTSCHVIKSLKPEMTFKEAQYLELVLVTRRKDRNSSSRNGGMPHCFLLITIHIYVYSVGWINQQRWSPLWITVLNWSNARQHIWLLWYCLAKGAMDSRVYHICVFHRNGKAVSTSVFWGYFGL